MKAFINDLIEIGIGNAVDMSNHKVVMQDEVHHRESIRSYELQDKLMDSLTEEQKELFEEYIDAISAVKDRACNLSYLLGAQRVMELSKDFIE